MATSPNDIYAEWRAAYELLQTGEYERATELLRTVQMTHTQSGNLLAATTAGAARQICLALLAYQNEIEWHHLARGNAELRERTLNQHALSMMALVGEQVAGAFTPPPPRQRPVSPPHTPAEPEKQMSLWQRFQNLFERLRQAEPALEEQTLRTESQDLLWPMEEVQPPVDHVEEEIATEPPPRNEPVEQPAPETPEPVDEAPLPPPPAEIVQSDEVIQSALVVQPEESELSPEGAEADQEPPALTIYCLGPFRVFQNGELLEDWNGQKGVSILKYLIAHHETSISKDVLMDVFWPDADPEAARRNLHQAIYSLRQTLRRRDPGLQHIRFENNQYLLNPELDIWLDVEEFEEYMQRGRRLENAEQMAQAMTEYSVADSLYQGDFLAEDLFEDWSHAQRAQLRMAYLEMADRLGEYYLQQNEYSAAIALCQKILTLENCDEEAHRRLMRCYLAQGQRHLAIRQYHACVQTLQDELEVPPSAETSALYEQITSAG
ncbi:MAG: BTAD domain-containing putative transcriptional regulator [Caldilineaceae bacterium]